MKHLKKFNESEDSPYDVILSEAGYNIVIGYRKDIEDDYSSPFHKGQVIPKDFDEDFDVEEVDFRYHESINKSIVKKLLEDYITKNYDGKLVKIIYH